ncbi:MAG TPA: Blp family class II bacteriocin [Kofleriaceae bacterium]|jgi:hypothetical protein|nr:Blp family class II bacteriocin [Kofleriaceae bacterium]
MSTQTLATIDFAALADVTGGYNWKETGKAAFGSAVAGAASGVVGGAMTAGPAGALAGAGIGAVSGAVGGAIYDAGAQLHVW